MTKFAATSMKDLRTVDRNASRRVRGVKFIVACEADDASWFELDADSTDHAITLAKDQVDKMNCRGCSCWTVKNNGSLDLIPFHTVFQSYEIENVAD